MRKLLYCSLGDAVQLKWAEQNGNVWENRSLKCAEYGAPELQEAYDQFRHVLLDLLRFEGLTDAINHRVKVDSISIQYVKGTDRRLVQVKGGYLLMQVGHIARITTPKLPEDMEGGSFLSGKFPTMLDALQDECCKYIDGCRAQQVLDLESATVAETQDAAEEEEQ